jgi:hypothetical protein
MSDLPAFLFSAVNLEKGCGLIEVRSAEKVTSYEEGL